MISGYNVVRRGMPWEEGMHKFMTRYYEAGIEKSFLSDSLKTGREETFVHSGSIRIIIFGMVHMCL